MPNFILQNIGYLAASGAAVGILFRYLLIKKVKLYLQPRSLYYFYNPAYNLKYYRYSVKPSYMPSIYPDWRDYFYIEDIPENQDLIMLLRDGKALTGKMIKKAYDAKAIYKTNMLHYLALDVSNNLSSTVNINSDRVEAGDISQILTSNEGTAKQKLDSKISSKELSTKDLTKEESDKWDFLDSTDNKKTVVSKKDKDSELSKRVPVNNNQTRVSHDKKPIKHVSMSKKQNQPKNIFDNIAPITLKRQNPVHTSKKKYNYSDRNQSILTGLKPQTIKVAPVTKEVNQSQSAIQDLHNAIEAAKRQDIDVTNHQKDLLSDAGIDLSALRNVKIKVKPAAKKQEVAKQKKSRSEAPVLPPVSITNAIPKSAPLSAKVIFPDIKSNREKLNIQKRKAEIKRMVHYTNIADLPATAKQKKHRFWRW